LGTIDSEIAALLRTVLDEICEGRDDRKRSLVAARLLEAAEKGERSLETLKAIGRKALRDPTMWGSAE
jgi:hypothetical protein